MSLVPSGTNVDSRENGAFAVAYRSLGLWLIGRQAEAQRAFVLQATQGLGMALPDSSARSCVREAPRN
jgi:hypothetical protein